MKKLIICMAVVFIGGCSQKKQEIFFALPDDYKKWKKTVDKVLDYTVPGHGATFRVIYANDIAFKPAREKDLQGRERVVMKEGSIIIKEIYKRREDINREIPLLTIMKKESANELAIKNWLFILKKPGQKAEAVTGRMCIGCHESANEAHPYFDNNPGNLFRDYLFAPILK